MDYGIWGREFVSGVTSDPPRHERAGRSATRLVGAGFPAIPEVGINTRRSQREPEEYEA